MTRYFIRLENGVYIITNQHDEDVAFYSEQYGRNELKLKKQRLEEKGIELVGW